MKDVREYVADFHPPLERLEALLERVQRDAYTQGRRDASNQMYEIAEEHAERIKRKVDEARK